MNCTVVTIDRLKAAVALHLVMESLELIEEFKQMGENA